LVGGGSGEGSGTGSGFGRGSGSGSGTGGCGIGVISGVLLIAQPGRIDYGPSSRCSDTIGGAFDAGLPRAVGTAEDLSVRLNTVADNTAATVPALRRELVNRAFKAVERVAAAACAHFE
jgi:hypothetical protein